MRCPRAPRVGSSRSFVTAYQITCILKKKTHSLVVCLPAFGAAGNRKRRWSLAPGFSVSADDIDYNCEAVTPRTDNVSPEACKAKCQRIRDTCKGSAVDFLSCIATKRQTTQFDKECATKGKLVAGRGIVFCKGVPKDCKYSEWSEWSDCSATCRNGPGSMADSVRLRTRQVVEPGSNGGEPCRLGSISSKACSKEPVWLSILLCTMCHPKC